MIFGSLKKQPHSLVPGIRDRQDVSKAGSCGGKRRELGLLTHPGKSPKSLGSDVQNTLSQTQKIKTVQEHLLAAVSSQAHVLPTTVLLVCLTMSRLSRIMNEKRYCYCMLFVNEWCSVCLG